jgi:hypothetical protein
MKPIGIIGTSGLFFLELVLPMHDRIKGNRKTGPNSNNNKGDAGSSHSRGV